MVRNRSPSYPILALGEAFAHLADFEARFELDPVSPEKVGEAWGIKAKAYGDRILAALRYYGLVNYQRGNGAKGSEALRYVKVSLEGSKYLSAQDEETRREIVKAAALRPKLFAKYFKLWGSARPVSATMFEAALEQLGFEGGFSRRGAAAFIKVYFDSIEYANLTNADEREDNAPMKAQTVQERPTDPQSVPSALTASIPIIPNSNGAHREIISLDEGDVVITYPTNLSSESFADLKEHLVLFVKKLERRVGTPAGQLQ